MFKKVMSVILCVCLCLGFSACSKTPATENPANTTPSTSTPDPSDGASEDTTPEIVLETNPLTGVADFDPEKINVRPVAVMIDNDAVAQKNAQAGVPYADVVFETEAEGGITRLMALFADISKAPQIGDVRSARVVFLEIATGFNAIYAHHGEDKVYCAPMFSQLGTDHYVIDSNNCGWRHTYGASTNWQNLYTNGEKLWNSLTSSGWKTTQTEFKPWQNFTSDTLALTDGTASKATVKFSNSSTSYFTYNPTTGKYVKTSAHAQNKDIIDGAAYEFKNVFVLKANMSIYPDNKHRKIDLSSGTGYYLVNGTYEKINWKKGKAANNFTFTKASDGTEITVEAGNSWVCIAKTDASITLN